MGMKPAPKTNRNEEIAERFYDGVPYTKLMEEYDISKTRVYAIVKKYKSNNRNPENHSTKP